MDYEAYTFVFFIKKINKIFFIKMWYILCFYFSTIEIYILKCNLPVFAYIKIKGSYFSPYYLPYIWIKWKFAILFFFKQKGKAWKNWAVDRLKMAYIQIIKGLQNLFIAANMWIHYKGLTLRTLLHCTYSKKPVKTKCRGC